MASKSLQKPAFTECPGCKVLCIGPTIFPCGHLVCRKCMRRILETQGHGPSCPFCERFILRADGVTVREMLDQLGSDLILEEMVMEQLAVQRGLPCQSCNESTATTLCVDCGCTLCADCSNSHQGMETSRDHVQKVLTGMTPKKRSRTTNTSTISDPSTQQQPSQDGVANTFRSPFEAEFDSVILKHESCRFRKKISHLVDVSAAVDGYIDRLQVEKLALDAQRLTLERYADRLADPDVALVNSTCTLLPRLKRMRVELHPISKAALIRITDQYRALLQAASGSAQVSFDPTLSDPRKVFTLTPATDDDTNKHRSAIASMLITNRWRLVMSDYTNKMIKTVDFFKMDSVQHVKLDARPRRMALLSDSVVAVTSNKTRIFIIDVSGEVKVTSVVKTERWYRAVGCLKDSDELLIACDADDAGLASVDVISRDGTLLMTFVDSKTLPELSQPNYMCFGEGEVFLADCNADAVFKLEAHTGDVLEKLTHGDLRGPHAVGLDKMGNCYICSRENQCVLVVTPSGYWRRLLHGARHGDASHVEPVALCVTSFGVIVSWSDSQKDCVVIGYDLTP